VWAALDGAASGRAKDGLTIAELATPRSTPQSRLAGDRRRRGSPRLPRLNLRQAA